MAVTDEFKLNIACNNAEQKMMQDDSRINHSDIAMVMDTTTFSDGSTIEIEAEINDQTENLLCNQPKLAPNQISAAMTSTNVELDCNSANHGCNIRSTKNKSVAFASTKTVKEFDVKTSTNYPEEELEVNFQSVSKLRRRKATRQVDAKRSPSSSIANLLSDSPPSDVKYEYEPRTIFTNEPLESTSQGNVKKTPIKVALIHSHNHTQILHKAMQYIHQDRDLLLESLLKWCGIFHGAAKGGPLSSFLSIVSPILGTRMLLEKYHNDSDYLDLLELPQSKVLRNMNLGVSDDQCNNTSDRNNANDGSEEEKEFQHLLAKYGLEDDCPLPTDSKSLSLLWNYCLAVTGASCHAASLLIHQEDVAIHWGGGRHHAHSNKAGGFCYVNDVVLAIRTLLNGTNSAVSIEKVSPIRRVLYIDLDIHHPDAVQSAFYSTDEVLTASFHRHSAGFFPASTGSISEKGQSGTKGLGFNINIPLPAGTGDKAFLFLYQKLLFDLTNAYDPHVIVLCVGADGLTGDPLVNGGVSDFDQTSDCASATQEGWMLSPECLAECVRLAAALCSGCEKASISILSSKVKDEPSEIATSGPAKQQRSDNQATAKNECLNDQGYDVSTQPVSDKSPTDNACKGKRRKLLVLGGGGYSPNQASRTWLLCTAAACEGARPGLFWNELPIDVPSHCYFPRYGPTFELVSGIKRSEFHDFYSSSKQQQMDEINAGLSSQGVTMLQKGIKTIHIACLYIERQRRKSETFSLSSSFCYETQQDDELWARSEHGKSKRKQHIRQHSRRKKMKSNFQTSHNQLDT
eukprot:scaffold1326_cov51-Cyclotella_meneghiniana.AAC.5